MFGFNFISEIGSSLESTLKRLAISEVYRGCREEKQRWRKIFFQGFILYINGNIYPLESYTSPNIKDSFYRAIQKCILELISL